MAPKRSAPPPPPPPPAASSEETASGSGSEEEEEEEIAHSPPPPAPKSVAPPPQVDQESEASDEEEDGEDDDDEEEEEEDEKANHVIPSSAAKNQPPPPAPAPAREESETSDEEEEEEEEGEEAADDEMPQKKPAPNQEMESKGAKRPSAPFQRTWSNDDEFRILEALAAHRQEHGTLPQTDVLANALAGKLDNSGCSLPELNRKVKSLHSRITKAVKKGALPSKDHDRRLFDLFKIVWPSVTKAATKVGANSAGREPDEMCELYPYLAEEVKELQKASPGLFKREFGMIDDSKASALNEKIKKHRNTQMKLYMRRHDLTKEVTKTLMDLAG